MKKTFFIKKTIIIIFMILFVLSSVLPLGIGNKLNISDDKIIVNEHNILNYNNSVFSIVDTPTTNMCNNEPIPTLNKNTNNNVFSNVFIEGPWPMYCHDARHTGRSPYSTVDNLGIEKWRFNTINECSGSPVIDKEGVIYIGGFYLFAVNPNGTAKWQYTINGRIVSAPAIDENGILYFGAIWNEYLFALYSSNGTVKWTYPIGPTWASPTVGPDGIIYAPATDNWNVIAFYPNGTVKWSFHANERVFSSPAIGDDGTIYCTSYGSYLYALYPENGTVKWQYHTGGSVRTSPCIADDGTVYVVSVNGVLHALYPNGTLKWQTDYIDGGTSPTIAQDGTIYCGYHRLYAINPNGSMKWVFDPGNIGSIKEGTPCNSLDGTIYFGTYASSGGELIAVNPDGTERWRIYLATGYIMSAPAIGTDGTVYIGSWNDDAPYGWGFLHAVKNNPSAPSSPEISGPVVGKPDVPLNFSFRSTSPVSKDLYYLIYWGDNIETGWIGPYSSGETIYESHRWFIKTNYIIRAWARDSDNNYSPPGEFSLTIKPRNKVFDISLLLKFLERFLLLEKIFSFF